MSERTCEKCERRSCMPVPYPARCARHEIEDVRQAQADAADRFRDHITALCQKKDRELAQLARDVL